MSQICLLAFTASFVALVAASSRAGELLVEVASYPSVPTTPEATLQGQELKLEKITEGRWRFHMSIAEGVLAPLTIAVASPGGGYDPFKLTLDIPYFWDGTAPRKVVAAIVNDEVTDNGVAAFLGAVGGGPTAIADIILVHQRAGRLWVERAKQLAEKVRWNPNADDVRIAYWLLRTTRDLMVSQFIEFDDTSRSAVIWLSGVLSNAEQRARLFNGGTISTAEAKDLLGALAARDAFLYNRIVQKLEEDLQANIPSTCPRIEALDAFFNTMESEDRKNYDGQFANSLKIKSDIVRCKAHDAVALKTTGAGIPGGQRAQFNSIIDSANAAVQEAQSAARFPKVREDVRSRVLELRSILD